MNDAHRIDLQNYDMEQERASEEKERAERARKHNVASGMVQCSGCGTWFYDIDGNYCSLCHPIS